MAILTLALGIGANTAIFGVVNGILLKALPYPDPDRVVGLWHTAPGVAGLNGNLGMSPSMYFTYREQGQAFQALGVWTVGGAAISGVAEPEQVQALFMTYGVLNALNVAPGLGRWFSESDTQQGVPETVILFHGYWQRRLGGDPNVIGRALNIDNKARTVIGVMPENFRFLNFAQAQIILPQQFDRSKVFLGNFSYQGLARLKPGVSMEQANTDIARLLPVWLNEWPAPPGFSKKLFADAHLGAAVQPLKQEVVGNIGDVLWVLMGTIGIVLLIACANVANLLLVRAEGRQQELTVRAALGANWKTLASEMFLESLILGLAGGVAGLGLAYGALRGLIAAAPENLPRLADIGIDPVVLAFVVGVSLLAAILFGVVPVWRYASPQIASALRAGGRSMSHGKERQRARHVLVVSQVALALVLLVGSGLMIRTFQALRRVDPGFTQPETLQIIRVSLPETLVQENPRVPRIQQAMLNGIAAVPGVKSVSFAGSVPLDGFNAWDVLSFEDKPATEGTVPPVRRYRYVAPGFFSTMGTALITGRDFEWNDIYDTHTVAIVSRNLAVDMWGSPQAALGKRIREGAADPWREIIGVAADVHGEGLDKPASATAYWPVYMKGFYGPEYVSRFVAFVIRSDRAGTENFLSDVRNAVWSVQPDLPIYLVQTMQGIYDTSMARTSFTLVMLAIAGVMAALLGAVGIYGVVAYAVTQRTREIGIRAALGADHRTLKAMFVRQGLVLAAIGVTIGLVASAGLARWMTALLYGVTPLDPVTYAAVPVVLLLTVVVASYWPARRAAKVDPLDCLRAH
jgi:predicted permease